jgi:hypothetical protein
MKAKPCPAAYVANAPQQRADIGHGDEELKIQQVQDQDRDMEMKN